MKVLTIASVPVTADLLRDTVGPEAQDAEVMVVAPAFNTSALRFWISDADDAIARAEHVESTTVSELRDAGIPAAGDTGDGDMGEAIRDALTTFPADRIVLYVRPAEDQRYREDAEPDELAKRFGVPVDRVEVRDAANPGT
jgi:hypothetical protein